MNQPDPVVRHMLLCEDVRTSRDNPSQVDVFGLVSAIRSLADPPFPLRYPVLCVYLQVTEGRGTGEGKIVAVHADSDHVAFATEAYHISFGPDPLAVMRIIFRVRNCIFASPGLYWIEFK